MFKGQGSYCIVFNNSSKTVQLYRPTERDRERERERERQGERQRYRQRDRET